ncbi:MAG TPA: hypothetical protein VII56_08645 [Rhizomicrobium sp.]
MRRLVLFVAAFVLCDTAACAAGADFDKTRAQCPGLANIDLAAVAAMTFDVAGVRETLAARAKPELGDADIVLRFHQSAGFGPAPYTIDATARHVKGQWLYMRQRKPGKADPPQGIETVEGPLPAGAARALDTALADSCFAREPNYAPRTIPLLGGDRETCFDGGQFLLQIERPGGVRTIRHDCAARWRAGEIMLLLRNAAPEPGTTHGSMPR